MSFQSRREKVRKMESLLEEFMTLRNELQSECDHSRVVKTIYRGSPSIDGYEEGVCLLCGLIEGSRDTLKELEYKPTKKVSNSVFSEIFAKKFKIELHSRLHPEFYLHLFPMSMINKMKGFKTKYRAMQRG